MILMILEIATEDWEVGDGSDSSVFFVVCKVTYLPLMPPPRELGER